MKFEEALKALREGKRVRHGSFCSGAYLCILRNGGDELLVIVDALMEPKEWRGYSKQLLAYGGWELVK
jgi:hypothetical protein